MAACPCFFKISAMPWANHMLYFQMSLSLSEGATVPLLIILTSFYSVLQSALAAVSANVYLWFGMFFESYFQH